MLFKSITHLTGAGQSPPSYNDAILFLKKNPDQNTLYLYIKGLLEIGSLTLGSAGERKQTFIQTLYNELSQYFNGKTLVSNFLQST